MTTETRRGSILKHDPAQILFIGDSNIGRLVKWLRNENPDGHPDELEEKILSCSRFAYSGRSSWFNLLNRIHGIKLPE